MTRLPRRLFSDRALRLLTRSLVAVFLVAATAAASIARAQGGVDALSRKARADSVRRAQRTAGQGGKVTSPSAPPAAAPAGVKLELGTTMVPPGKVKQSARLGAKARADALASTEKQTKAAGAAATAASATATPVLVAPTAAPPALVAPAPASTLPVSAPTQPIVATSAPTPVPPPRRLTQAQADSVRARWTVAQPVVWVSSPLARRVSPGLGFATPSGYGPAWGDFFMSVSYQRRTRFTQVQDGAVGVGMGLGDPVGAIGGELVYSSFGTVRSGGLSNGTISARVHRIVRGYGLSVGLENLVGVGRTTSAGPDGGRSAFFAVSQLRRLGGADSISASESSDAHEVLWTVGIGDGRFRRESDVFASRSTVNLFGSVGYRFMAQAAAIVDYTGQDVSIALSIAPFQCIPLVLTPGFADITGSAGDGARFVLAAGISTRFDRDAFFRRPCTR